MAFIHMFRWWLLASLAVTTVVACGKQAAPSAPFKQATATEASLLKGGDPVGVLPSVVVPGELAVYDGAGADAGPAKTRDAAGSLPSSFAAGRSAAYAPDRAAGAGLQASAGPAARP